ncbi:class I SAM-dependent methyltransferase [Jidongwangia harbinensis]|uniref:class I SAM-dependent methyltransferase n=1 Tax=Jidongwangia harbinensis TaxID=2878561 RepID=UPI001CD95496|nr:class I SAM-dependent methyltransferase [Jidongwangia harbinensis]MCA2211944.1 class I SAM-dependent methyltransferase [Jidongwangia harbinensis]
MPERIRWGVDLLDPGPAETLLEVGCGPGVAAELVCARLTTGRLLAVDRSPAAVARTSRRNAGHITAGRLTVRQASLPDLEVPDETIDAAYSINVNIFWTDPDGPAVAGLFRALRPGGRLLVLYGADAPTTGSRVTGPIAAAMSAAGLVDVAVTEGAGGSGVTGRRR